MKVFILILSFYYFVYAQFAENAFIYYDNNQYSINLHGNPHTQKLITNNAINFDGIDDIGKIKNLSFIYNNGFTISFWLKPLGYIIDDDLETYLFCNSLNDANVYWAIKITNQKVNSAKLSFVVAYLNQYYEVKTQQDILKNQIYHITCIYSKNKISIYVDGKKDASKNLNEFDFGEENFDLLVGGGVYNSKEIRMPIWIRDIPFNDRTKVIYGYFNGIVDDIKIYNKIITDDEIYNIYKTINTVNQNQKVKIIVHEPKSTRGLRIVKEKLIIKGEVIPANVAQKVEINGIIVDNFDGRFFSQAILLTKDINLIKIRAFDSKNKVLDELSFEYGIEEEKKNLELQSYHALVIACQNYRDNKITKLDYPIKNGSELIKVLNDYYNFNLSQTIFLKDPTYDEIIKTLDKLNKNLSSNDNLLIFFAGHGIYDNNQEQGYWLPVDANLNARNKWLSNSIIKDYLKGNKAKSILVISDACFSGALIKTRSIMSSSKYIQELIKNKSRKAITSGVLSVVPDKSVFMNYLIKELKINNELYLPAEVLYFKIKEKVVNNSPLSQLPMYGEIYNTGDEGGDFVFIKKFVK